MNQSRLGLGCIIRSSWKDAKPKERSRWQRKRKGKPGWWPWDSRAAEPTGTVCEKISATEGHLELQGALDQVCALFFLWCPTNTNKPSRLTENPCYSLHGRPANLEHILSTCWEMRVDLSRPSYRRNCLHKPLTWPRTIVKNNKTGGPPGTNGTLGGKD